MQYRLKWVGKSLGAGDVRSERLEIDDFLRTNYTHNSSDALL